MPDIEKKYALGIDIGGSHITAAIVDVGEKKILPHTQTNISLDSQQEADVVLEIWLQCIEKCLQTFGDKPILGVGVSMPGPANYKDGISEMKDCNKYEKLLGVNLKIFLYSKLHTRVNHPDKITFINDANSFLLGACWANDLDNSRTVAVTLGTGIGSGFMKDGEVITTDVDVPVGGEIYNLPFKEKRAEDWISTRWFLDTYNKKSTNAVSNVKQIAERTVSEQLSCDIFQEFGRNLGTFLAPILLNFSTKTLIIGGSINKSYQLFKSTFEGAFNGELPDIHLAPNSEDAAIFGAVNNLMHNLGSKKPFRSSDQYVMPINSLGIGQSQSYNIYPSFDISNGNIEIGFASLATEIAQYKKVCIDGYIGVNWLDFITKLTVALAEINVSSIAYAAGSALKSEAEIEQMISPYLGGEDPVFGRIFPGELADFMELENLNSIQANTNCLSILYGTGAALSTWDAQTIYIDVPKNEIQYRSRAGQVLNVGAANMLKPKAQYKRMFFVDWPMLNKHKQQLLSSIDYIIDGQYADNISWSNGTTLRNGLQEISENAFRVRPWFEPGIWGGEWIKNNINGLNKNVVNYAWSFECIVPENGIVFSQRGNRLEVSFDLLMYYNNKAILGDAATVFGTDFPIRFDFLDTFNGDNLSLQCHPSPEYIKEHFSEPFTQDETYYMLDAEPDAKVYLGFHKDINEEKFHKALLKSNNEATPMDVEQYVQVHHAKKHDLFLIPHGTVHCSGKNSLVLEISSTPYIYTFKLYDWMRKDLDGQPRPLNIARGMQNLNFDCKGVAVKEEYIAKPTVIDQGNNWQIVQLNTHAKHFYAIFRLEFKNELIVETHGQCHILNLVEGDQIKIITGSRTMIINYAETFIVPAAAQTYQLINLSNTAVKVIQSYVKPDFFNNEH